MKLKIAFLICFCFNVVCFAQVDTSHVIAAGMSAATYSVMSLLGLSLLGIFAHVLSDVAKSQQNKTFVNLNDYLKSTWAAIALSFVICLIIIITRHEMMGIPDFTNWEGLTMAGLGFCGRSVLIPLLNSLTGKFGIKTTPDV